MRGWALNLAAVRRRQNEAADGAATEGVYKVARMAERGIAEPCKSIARYNEGRE